MAEVVEGHVVGWMYANFLPLVFGYRLYLGLFCKNSRDNLFTTFPTITSQRERCNLSGIADPAVPSICGRLLLHFPIPIPMHQQSQT